MGTVDVTVGELPNSLVISKFAVTQNTDGSVTADYKITDSRMRSMQKYLQIQTLRNLTELVFTVNIWIRRVLFPLIWTAFQVVSIIFISVYLWMESISGRTVTDLSAIRIRMIHRRQTGVKGGTYNDGYYISWNAAEDEAYTVLVWDEAHNLIKEEAVGATDAYYGDYAEDASKVYLAVVRANESCMYDLITAVFCSKSIGRCSL